MSAAEPLDTKCTASKRRATRKQAREDAKVAKPAKATKEPKVAKDAKVAKELKVAKDAKVAKQAKAAKAEPAAKAQARLAKEVAAEATHADGVLMTWKCIHSRAYHGAIRKAKLQGLSDVEAKEMAAEAIAEAKKMMSRQ